MLPTISNTKGTWRNIKKRGGKVFPTGITQRPNVSKWGVPHLPHPKLKVNGSRFLIYFRNLNRKLKLKPYPMSNIGKNLLKSESFKHSTSLDLNMGYYHIQLIENVSNSFTNIFPWRKNHHIYLPTGVINSLDIFPQETNNPPNDFNLYLCK